MASNGRPVDALRDCCILRYSPVAHSHRSKEMIEKMVSNTTIRMNRDSDGNDANRLFNLVFGGKRSLNEWRWKFEAVPGGPGVFTVAEVNGKLVAQYPSLPVRLKCGDSVIRAAQSVDALVHPEFRGSGALIARLLSHHVAYVRDHGFAFAFGFPNAVHHRVGKKLLNYKDLFWLHALFRRLSWGHAVRTRASYIPGWALKAIAWTSRILIRVMIPDECSGSTLTTREVRDFSDKRFDLLWNAAKENYAVLAVRDSEFLNWRYARNPSHSYVILAAEKGSELVGYTVLSIDRQDDVQKGEIVDLLAVDGKAEAALIGAALSWFHSQQADYALCYALREDGMSGTLARFGFREHPAFPPIPVVYQLYRQELEALLTNSASWHITHGDALDAV